MAATKEDIRKWLEAGKRDGATHVIIVCDTFDWEDYPVYVPQGSDVSNRVGEYQGKNMQKVMEVYSLKRDIEAQLAETRAYHLD